MSKEAKTIILSTPNEFYLIPVSEVKSVRIRKVLKSGQELVSIHVELPKSVQSWVDGTDEKCEVFASTFDIGMATEEYHKVMGAISYEQ